MKVIELLKIGGEMLKVLSKCDVSRDDWRFIELYEDFMKMRSEGLKYRACVMVLSEKYHVSRATVERAVKRLSAEC